jgi:hypothetical protein
MTVRFTEAEFVRDVRAELEKVEQGSEVIIEHQDHRPPAVIHSVRRSGRPITEILSEATQRNSTATLDEDFGKDVEDIIASHQQPWQSPSLSPVTPEQNPESEKALHQFCGQGLRSAGLEPAPQARSECTVGTAIESGQ